MSLICLECLSQEEEEEEEEQEEDLLRVQEAFQIIIKGMDKIKVACMTIISCLEPIKKGERSIRRSLKIRIF